MTRKLKKDSFMALYTLVVIVAVIVLNLAMGKLPAKYLKHDLSSSEILILGDTIRDILTQLGRDVTIYVIANPNSVDERIPSFVELYKDPSPHASVEVDDPALHPDILALLDTGPGNLIIPCESTGKKTSASSNDIIQFNPMVYYQYGQIKETVFDGEGRITSATRYATSDTAATVHTLTGHGEITLTSAVVDTMGKPGMNITELNLLTQGVIPQDRSFLIMNALARDISANEKEILADYLKNGGRILLPADCTQDTLANLTNFISQYGMDLKNGFVADLAPQYFYNNNPLNAIPDHDLVSSLLSRIDSSATAPLVQPVGMTVQENPSGHIAVQPFFTTSDFTLLADPLTQERTQGTCMLEAVATEIVNEEESISSMLTIIMASNVTDDSILSCFPNIINLTLFMNAATSGLPGTTPLSIPGRDLDTTCSMVTSAELWSALFIIVIPVISLAAGFVIRPERWKL